MKIYNGLRYPTIGNRSIFTSYEYRIEKIYRPLAFLWKWGLDIPIAIKCKLHKPGNKEFEFNPKMLEHISEYVDIQWRDIGSECESDSLMVQDAVSRQDGSIIGGPDDAYKYIRQGITEFFGSRGCQYSNIGYIPKDKKWVGWSHRAMGSFGIGSTVKKGDIAFQASNFKDWLEDILNWYSCDAYSKKHISCDTGEILVYNQKDGVDSGKGTFVKIPEKWGKGEWTAKTLKEAKQMAIDFAEDVA